MKLPDLDIQKGKVLKSDIKCEDLTINTQNLYNIF